MKQFLCLFLGISVLLCGCTTNASDNSAADSIAQDSAVASTTISAQPESDTGEKNDVPAGSEEEPAEASDSPVIYSGIEDIPFCDLEFVPIVFEDTGESIENFFIYRDGEEWVSTGPGTTGYYASDVISNSEYLMVRFNEPLAWHIYSYKRIYDYDNTQVRFTPLLYRLDYTNGKNFMYVDTDGALVLEDGNRFYLDTLTWTSPEGTVMPNEEGGVGQITILQGLG